MDVPATVAILLHRLSRFVDSGRGGVELRHVSQVRFTLSSVLTEMDIAEFSTVGRMVVRVRLWQ